MKMIAVLLLVTALHVFAKTNGQYVTLTEKNVPVEKVLTEIKRQTGFDFWYQSKMLQKAGKISVSVNNEALSRVLDLCFANLSISWKIINNVIVLKEKTASPEEQANLAPIPPILIKGKVTDEHGDPVDGVSVIERGTNNSKVTDNRGAFAITVANDKAFLVFSHTSFVEQHIAVKNKAELNVSLIGKANNLEEYIVIGYQTVNRKDVSGAISSMNGRQIKDIPANSAAEALTGRLAGVQIVTTDGAPGSPAQIKVRSGISISQDNSPLYIIDGVQVEDGLSYIAPQDIEKIDVLKDASSTAIYGARGANGVVVITTKSGKEGKTTVTVNSFLGGKRMNRKIPVMGPYNFVEYQYERTRRSVVDSASFHSRYGATWNDLAKYKTEEPIDWQEKLFGRHALMMTNNVTISGGNKNSQFSISGTQNREDGIMLENSFKRKLLNFKFDHNANDKLKISFSARYNRDERLGSGSNTIGGSETKLRNAIKYRPVLGNSTVSEDDFDQEYFDETSKAGNGLGVVSPVLLNQQSYRKIGTDLINLGGSINYKISKLISFKTTVGFNMSMQNRESFDDSLTSNSRTNGSSMPILSTTAATSRSFNNSNVFTITNAALKNGFHRDNRISLLLGQEVNLQRFRSTDLQLRNFPNGIPVKKAIGQQSLGQPYPAGIGPQTKTTEANLASLFAKIDYGYKGRYTASFSIRGDKSSKFAPDRNLGYFPAGSVSWKLSDEKFMRKITQVNFMKLRASFGQSGNNRITDYAYLTTLGTATGVSYGLGNTSYPGFVPLLLSNTDLKWEKAVSKNIGLDMGLLNDRFSLSVDYYNNTGQDLLMQTPIPSTSGYSTQFQNVASTVNSGVELQLTANIIRKKEFTWSADFNISFNKSMIKKIANQQTGALRNSGFGATTGKLEDFEVKVGSPVGVLYGFVADGFYTLDDFDYDDAGGIYTLKKGIANSGYFGTAQPGSIKIRDLDDDGTITADGDRQALGTTNPRVFGGLNQQFSYKNFDFSAFVNFSLGNKIFNASKIEFSNAYNLNINMYKAMEGRWRTVDANGKQLQYISGTATPIVYGAPPAELAAANANATIWQPLRGVPSTAVTSWGVENGSFLRVNNLTLGYTIPGKLLSKVNIKKLRFYFTANNIALVTSYSGQDPEVNTQISTPLTPGVDYSAYPRSRTFIFGLNLSL